MARYITATEANQRFSAVLREVHAGETFVVTSRGKPVAEISAPKKTVRKKKSIKTFVENLQKREVLITGPYTRDDIYDRNW